MNGIRIKSWIRLIGNRILCISRLLSIIIGKYCVGILQEQVLHISVE